MYTSVRIICFCCLFLGSSLPSLAQDANASDKKVAYQLFKDKNYSQALIYLISYHEQKPTDIDAHLKLAICYYHNNEIDAASIQIKNLLGQQKKLPSKVFLYKAYLSHDKGAFNEAIFYYKRYLRNAKGDSVERRKVKRAILNCANGLQLQYQSKNSSVQNLGAEVNGSMDDAYPIPSPNYDDLVYFSTNRVGSWDMYGATFSQEAGDNTSLFPLEINSNKQEQLIDFNRAGSAMRFLRYDSATPQVLVDTFRQDDTHKVMNFPNIPLPIQASDSTLFFFNDSILLFASAQLEGYGGYDLFLSQRIRGQWASPKNLGETINSPYDELAPFLADDGLTLYFSSNHTRKSIGGLDIFKSQFDVDKEAWSNPKNLGLVINSAQEDSNFRMSASGLQAFFNSNRWNGQGKHDLYIAYLNGADEEMNPSESIPFYNAQAFKQAKLSEQLENQQKKKKGLSYRILIATESKLDRSIIPANYPDIKIRPSSDGQQFRYFVGLYRTYRSAKQLQLDLLKAGWETAKIVSYVNGIELKEEEIEFMKERYPDLENMDSM